MQEDDLVRECIDVRSCNGMTGCGPKPLTP